jgi:hypothetical protein
MISYTVFQFTQRATENRSTCHAWHACHRLLTSDVTFSLLLVILQYKLYLAEIYSEMEAEGSFKMFITNHLQERKKPK